MVVCGGLVRVTGGSWGGAAGNGDGVGWVVARGFHVAGGAVDCGDMLPCEAEPGLDLSAVVTGVEDSSPEDPDALASEVVEERAISEPPLGCGRGELGDSEFAEVDVFFGVGGS